MVLLRGVNTKIIPFGGLKLRVHFADTEDVIALQVGLEVWDTLAVSGEIG